VPSAGKTLATSSPSVRLWCLLNRRPPVRYTQIMTEEHRAQVQKRPAVPRTAIMGQRFWQQAERDLTAALMTLQPGGYYVAANLAHQAAEKALKAAHWHLRAEEPPWHHDLAKCTERVVERASAIPPEVDAAISRLEPMFERSRYPSADTSQPIPADLIGEAEARDAIVSAQEVMTWVQMLLQQPPSRPARKKRS
jgi:HEPN domain-containing protein